VEENGRLPGSRILEGQITGVQQAIAAPRGREEAARHLREFVAEVKRSGFVSLAIANNGVEGVNVAP
jgi:polar amino acid transport system substrate-binding protein